MKIEKFLLKAFDDKKPDPLIHLNVPEYSVFQKAIILHEGVTLLYAVPEIQTTAIRLDTYALLQPGESIPDDSILIDILDGVFEIPDSGGGQGVMLFPIYKIN